jgi:hypothetical protein
VYIGVSRSTRLRRSILVGVFAALLAAGATVAQGSTWVRADSVTVSPEYPFFDPLASQPQDRLAVAWSGSLYLAAWERESDLYAGRLNAAGQFLDGAGIRLASEANMQGRPRIAWDGTNFLVVWTDDRGSSSSWDVYGARVRPDGFVLDPGGFPIA